MSPRRSQTLALFTTAAPQLAKQSCWVVTLALLACPVGAADYFFDSVRGVDTNDGATHCVVTGCTISKLKSNDGVTCHDGPPVESGDHNVIENNVISFCPENSVDLTSGDYHVVRGNICYRDGESDIALGHGADHILVQNNLCFGATRSGIKVGGNPAEGFHGGDQIWQNLIFDCGYPGLEIEASSTQVLNNTIVNVRDRRDVRLSGTARDVVFRDNLIATLDKTIPHPCLQFARSDPKTLNTLLSHNVFFHAGRGGKNVSVWVGTRHEDFTPEETVARYGVGQHCLTGHPRFAPASGRRFFLAVDSPCVDAGVEVGLPFVGEAPDVGWKELGSEAEAPSFPEVMIESPEDDAAVLYLWGKTTDKPARASTLLAGWRNAEGGG